MVAQGFCRLCASQRDEGVDESHLKFVQSPLGLSRKIEKLWATEQIQAVVLTAAPDVCDVVGNFKETVIGVVTGFRKIAEVCMIVEG